MARIIAKVQGHTLEVQAESCRKAASSLDAEFQRVLGRPMTTDEQVELVFAHLMQHEVGLVHPLPLGEGAVQWS